MGDANSPANKLFWMYDGHTWSGSILISDLIIYERLDIGLWLLVIRGPSCSQNSWIRNCCSANDWPWMIFWVSSVRAMKVSACPTCSDMPTNHPDFSLDMEGKMALLCLVVDGLIPIKLNEWFNVWSHSCEDLDGYSMPNRCIDCVVEYHTCICQSKEP